MSRIRSTNTKPERIVRSLVHKMGYRFRLHRKDLPGTPDLVFVRLRKVVFVHGCYWHMHSCPNGRVVPKTRTKYWQEKRRANVDRDRRQVVELQNLGLDVFVVWECEVKNEAKLKLQLVSFLEAPG